MANGDDPTQAGGGDETQMGGQPVTEPTSPETDADRRRRYLLLGLGALLLVLILAGLAVALGGGDDDADDTAATTSTSSSSSTTSTSLVTTTTGPAAPPSGGGGGGGTGTTAPSNTPTIALNASSGTNPPCSVDVPPGNASQTDPLNFTVSWSTTNATQTVLSIDGPGAYATYGPSGSYQASIACPSPNTTESHTYLVTATGPNGQAQKTITVTLHSGP